MRESLGSDSKNAGKVLGITIFGLILFYFSFMASNATPDVQAVANFYLYLGLIFIGLFVVDQIFVKGAKKQLHGADIPDTLTYEEESPLGLKLPRWGKLLLIVGGLLLGAWIFFNVGSRPTMSIVAAPTFAAIDIGPEGNAFMSGIAGITEDLFFFGLLGPIIFGLIMAFTGQKIFAMAGAFGITPFVFMAYHLARYSASPTALDSVLIFGFVAMAITIFLGTLWPVHCIHFANNAAVTYFSKTSADVTGYFFIFIGVIALVSVLYWVKRRRR